MESASTATDQAKFRDELVRLVQRELCGPHSTNEVLATNPQARYICGQIAPIRAEDEEVSDAEADQDELGGDELAGASQADLIDSATVDGEAADDGEVDSSESSSISKARRDSLTSIGISFSIMPGQVLNYCANWGQYERNGDGTYQRSRHSADGKISIDGPCNISRRDHGRGSIRWIAKLSADRIIGTVFFANISTSTSTDGTERLYQAELEIACDSTSSGFLPRAENERKRGRLDINDLLYRERREFGVGLHTAVQPAFDSAGRCCALTTWTIPAVEMRVTDSRRVIANSMALDMQWLADTQDAETTCAELKKLVAEYENWLLDLQTDAIKLSKRYDAHSEVQFSYIASRIARLLAGIETIRLNEKAFLAFRFANEAMSRAQYRSRKDRPSVDQMATNGRFGQWRPFQIAFIVSTIPEIVDPELAEREVVDVLFFPTGGGKTEAYLGLSAFAMGLRRISGAAANRGAGTSTLMRYTLRLLTTQQFTRAATLVCASEAIRRDRTFGAVLGDQPFSIGLWVGPMTPSRYDDAFKAIKQAREEHFQCPRGCSLSKAHRDFPPKAMARRETANVLPISECPWCFTSICIENASLDTDARRVVIKCPNELCAYSKDQDGPGFRLAGLPIFVVDEDVYRLCPTIVVATVDKFATMPFRGEAKSLFGHVNGYCLTCGFLTDATEHKGHKDRYRSCDPNAPIDVIVQDELHTITDNLGSIYGLYETAIDYLTSRDGIGPKYVCATATVKDVATQVEALYGFRKTAVFPPTGLLAGDTFFSKDVDPSSDSRGRTYVGIYAPAFSRLSTFVAVLGALLSIPEYLRSVSSGGIADPYMTLLGYFNTVRDLGGVKALLGDDVPPVLEEIAKRNQWPVRRLSDWESELTGRISSSEVPDRLRTLDSKYRDGVGCDFMAATNMISVGVDVPRLGIMLVDGQPKSTSEYIQATSRVGRSSPGVVFVVFNAMRPRDLSHYEHFMAYHDSIYRSVEAGSITPFSDGAVDRYLRAAIVACYRMSAERSSNDAASRFAEDPDGIANVILQRFRDRAARFGEHESRSAESALDELVEKWRSAPANLEYFASTAFAGGSNNKPKKKRATVLRAADEPEHDSVVAIFSAARSMRNVEADVPLLLRIDD